MYSPRVEEAVTTMLEAHGVARRKAGQSFQATHALSVAMIVTDCGFDEDTVVAALLHTTRSRTRTLLPTRSGTGSERTCWRLFEMYRSHR